MGILLMLLASNFTVPSHASSTKVLLLIKNSSISTDLCETLPQVSNIGQVLRDKSGKYACLITTRIDWATKDNAIIKINTYPIFTQFISYKKNKSLAINYSLIEELCEEAQYERDPLLCPKTKQMLESTK